MNRVEVSSLTLLPFALGPSVCIRKASSRREVEDEPYNDNLSLQKLTANQVRYRKLFSPNNLFRGRSTMLESPADPFTVSRTLAFCRVIRFRINFVFERDLLSFTKLVVYRLRDAYVIANESSDDLTLEKRRRINRLPLTSLVHALIKRHIQDAKEITKASEALRYLLTYEARYEAKPQHTLVCWNALRKKTLYAIIAHYTLPPRPLTYGAITDYSYTLQWFYHQYWAIRTVDKGNYDHFVYVWISWRELTVRPESHKWIKGEDRRQLYQYMADYLPLAARKLAVLNSDSLKYQAIQEFQHYSLIEIRRQYPLPYVFVVLAYISTANSVTDLSANVHAETFPPSYKGKVDDLLTSPIYYEERRLTVEFCNALLFLILQTTHSIAALRQLLCYMLSESSRCQPTMATYTMILKYAPALGWFDFVDLALQAFGLPTRSESNYVITHISSDGDPVGRKFQSLPAVGRQFSLDHRSMAAYIAYLLFTKQFATAVSLSNSVLSTLTEKKEQRGIVSAPTATLSNSILLKTTKKGVRKRLAAQDVRYPQIDPALVTTLLNVTLATGKGQIGLAQRIWFVATVAEINSIRRMKIRLRAGRPCERVLFLSTSAYMTLFNQCLMQAKAGLAKPFTPVRGWDAGVIRSRKLLARIPVSENMSRLDAARNLAWRVYQQLRLRLALDCPGRLARYKPDYTLHMCLLLLQIFHSRLERYSSLEEAALANPVDWRHRQILNDYRFRT